MATGKTLVPDKEIKVEDKTAPLKDEVKVTNLLTEIRTTDLPKESPMEVDTSKEKKSDPKDKEEGEITEGGNKINEVKDKEEKVEDAKSVENSGKKKEEDNKVDAEKKKAEDVKNEDKKTDDKKKVENGGKKSDDEKKVESGDKKDKNSEKSKKKEKVSPLASFFQDWDKFSTKQKIDIERYIKDKAEQLGAPSKLKPGVRTYSEREKNWFKWNAIRRRRESRRIESSRLGGSRSRPSRERLFPTRLRGAGDARSRIPRDNRSYRRYSPRREALPWRSPWNSPAIPVENLLKQMQRFVQMVDKLPNPNNMIRGEPNRLALLPTPPNGYNLASRGNILRDAPIDDSPRDYQEKNFAPSQRWPAPPFSTKDEDASRRLFGKEPSSKTLSKPRPSPYNSRSAFSSAAMRNDSWSNRERVLSHTATMGPYKESRYNSRRH